MAGVKRRTKYRKQVEADVLDAFHTPEDGQEIVQIVQSHGSNILEVRDAEGENAKCILPTKYRKLIWVKRGDFLIVSKGAEDYDTASGNKGTVKYMVEHILTASSIKHLKKEGLWPATFDTTNPRGAAAATAASAPSEETAGSGAAAPAAGEDGEDSSSSSDGDMPGVQRNLNRRRVYVQSSESDSSSEEDE